MLFFWILIVVNLLRLGVVVVFNFVLLFGVWGSFFSLLVIIIMIFELFLM